MLRKRWSWLLIAMLTLGVFSPFSSVSIADAAATIDGASLGGGQSARIAIGGDPVPQGSLLNMKACPDPVIHVVQVGETLSSIAAQYGVPDAAIAEANNIANPNLIYVGERLSIPTCANTAPVTTAPTGQTIHIVQSGETLWSIGQQYGVSADAIAQANNITNIGVIYVGQRLVIPDGTSSPGPAAPVNPAPAPVAGNGGKLIEVNLSSQWMTAYEGNQVVLSSGVSTGRPGWDTPPGRYAIYTKYPVQTMTGAANGETWYVPNVPSVMYFYGGDALHGTYWHNQFGTGARLSHGCVNLPLNTAEQLYNWAPIGTTVWVHY